MTTEGRKGDAQKARYDLLPPELMVEYQRDRTRRLEIELHDIKRTK